MANFGKLGRFEVYSIVIEKLSRDLGMIALQVGDKVERLFNQTTEKKMEIGKPLQLSGPVEPISPYDPIGIVFGDPNKSEWSLLINYDDAERLDQIDRPITVEVKDPESDSVAVVCYALLSEAVDANFLFSLEDPNGHTNVQILYGEISVTTDDDGVKCLLQSFNDDSSKMIYSGVPITLGRSRVSMSTDSYLQVTVNLDLGVTNINHTHRFFVPPPTHSISPYPIPYAAVHLRLEVNWRDELAYLYAKEMESIMPAVDALREQLTVHGINPREDFLFPAEVDADAAEVDADAAKVDAEQRTSMFGWPLNLHGGAECVWMAT